MKENFAENTHGKELHNIKWLLDLLRSNILFQIVYFFSRNTNKSRGFYVILNDWNGSLSKSVYSNITYIVHSFLEGFFIYIFFALLRWMFDSYKHQFRSRQ